MRHDGKTVVLTGAAGGIGSLLCRELKREGATVVGVDRVDCPEADETIMADLATQSGLADICNLLSSRRVDLLVNLAGMQYFGLFDRQEPDQIWTGYVVNLIAPATLMRCVLPQMQARGDGQIVNIGSVLGAVNYPYFATYSSSKAGLRGLSEALRRELGKSPIAITYIAPEQSAQPSTERRSIASSKSRRCIPTIPRWSRGASPGQSVDAARRSRSASPNISTPA
ncbi:SDR family NAD(P)-dependent oxidoreductase [Sphingomonas sediminicola]|uniref:SDR family NAD(P)-dependent oxidoreductase n=1 Tax=Sphingomonas sediminicola TaxID=386874 RepID=UPI001FE37B39|nr:SDR family NAD(P)-dependent oxidoreductase [Sphingomonas sediminicola]